MDATGLAQYFRGMLDMPGVSHVLPKYPVALAQEAVLLATQRNSKVWAGAGNIPAPPPRPLQANGDTKSVNPVSCNAKGPEPSKSTHSW
jgi:hypothetical protein